MEPQGIPKLEPKAIKIPSRAAQNGDRNGAKSLQILSRSPSGSGSRRRRKNARIGWHKDASTGSHWDPSGLPGWSLKSIKMRAGPPCRRGSRKRCGSGQAQKSPLKVLPTRKHLFDWAQGSQKPPNLRPKTVGRKPKGSNRQQGRRSTKPLPKG